MRFTFTERKVEISDEVREYAQKKFQKLDRYFNQDASAHLTFSIERGRHVVEATVHYAHLFFRAVEKTNDMYASIDGSIDSIERQIRKNKTRLEKRLREGAFDRAVPYEEPVVEEAYEVIRRKRFEVKPMTVDEAILQMNLLEHTFFFFKNVEDDNRACVVYTREESGYGLIESE